ncbi:MAG: CHRD domain-containing protein [Gemmatimonadales bacterium]
MKRRPRRGAEAGVVASAWLALVLAAACQPADETREGAMDDMPAASGAAAVQASDGPDTIFTAALQPADSTAAPAVSGEVAVVASDDIDEPLEIVVMGTGLPPGTHAWHVHTGPCGTDGPVRIPLSETPEAEGITGPIEADDQGEFEEAVEVPELNRTMVGTREHSLHIHRNGGANHGPTVACATI